MNRVRRSLEVVNNFETTPFDQTVLCAFDSQGDIPFLDYTS